MNKKEYILVISFISKEDAERFRKIIDDINGYSKFPGIPLFIKSYYPIFYVIDLTDVIVLKISRFLKKLGMCI
jgi:hypothetical protein